MSKPKEPAIIPCVSSPETQKRIKDYIQALKEHAHEIGDHGLSKTEFHDSGLFRSAIESIRGTLAATTREKRSFTEAILEELRQRGEIAEWEFTGAGERHDYSVRTKNGRIVIIETKGCLDGNNTNIFERPPQADEFIIWSLCQNPGADPRKNAWSGIHTRLSAEIIHRQQRVDGLVIWDMLCGTVGRPCPKTDKETKRLTRNSNEKRLPPPCLYLFPRSLPDARNNPAPEVHKLRDVAFLNALSRVFGADSSSVVEVHIEARMEGADVQRRTRFVRGKAEIAVSEWTKVNRARR